MKHTIAIITLLQYKYTVSSEISSFEPTFHKKIASYNLTEAYCLLLVNWKIRWDWIFIKKFWKLCESILIIF